MHPLLIRRERIDGVMTVLHVGFSVGLTDSSSISRGVADPDGVDDSEVLPYVDRLALRRALTFEGRVFRLVIKGSRFKDANLTCLLNKCEPKENRNKRESCTDQARQQEWILVPKRRLEELPAPLGMRKKSSEREPDNLAEPIGNVHEGERRVLIAAIGHLSGHHLDGGPARQRSVELSARRLCG